MTDSATTIRQELFDRTMHHRGAQEFAWDRLFERRDEGHPNSVGRAQTIFKQAIASSKSTNSESYGFHLNGYLGTASLDRRNGYIQKRHTKLLIFRGFRLQ